MFWFSSIVITKPFFPRKLLNIQHGRAATTTFPLLQEAEKQIFSLFGQIISNKLQCFEVPLILLDSLCEEQRNDLAGGGRTEVQSEAPNIIS